MSSSSPRPGCRAGRPALLAHRLRDRADRGRVAAAAEHADRPLGGLAPDERCASHLERDAREGERLLVVLRARVQAVENGHLLVRDALARQPTHLADDELRFRLPVGLHQRQGLRAAREHRPQHLLRAAELRDEAVRQRQDLRRRAVVLLQPHDQRAREARRHPEQVLRRRAREGVDRLVVVADDAELVAVADPALQQRLLEQVHVLVLVDRERPVALLERGERVRILVEHLHRVLEEILEVDEAALGLARLVRSEHALHDIVGNRRLVFVQRPPIRLWREAAVLRPLDLRREVGERAEAERHRQRPRDRQQDRRLRGQHLADRAGEVVELGERGRVERPRGHAGDAQPRQPLAHLRRGLVRERDGEDLVGRERAARHLVGDAPRDRRRLARARAREDADRAAHGLDRAPLLGVEPVEDRLGVHRPEPSDGTRRASCRKRAFSIPAVSHVERRGPTGSYWVVPGRLLAGMYPAEDMLPELLAAGVDTFFDLTEDAELDPYELNGLEHRRFPIRDMSTPSAGADGGDPRRARRGAGRRADGLPPLPRRHRAHGHGRRLPSRPHAAGPGRTRSPPSSSGAATSGRPRQTLRKTSFGPGASRARRRSRRRRPRGSRGRAPRSRLPARGG